MKHYIKELTRNPVYLGGAKVRFEEFGNGNGGIVTANPLIQQSLETMIQRGQGGLRLVTAEEYAAAKEEGSKKKPRRPVTGNGQSPLRLWGEMKTSAPAPAAVPSEDKPEAPGLVVPTSRIPKARPRITGDTPRVVR